MAKKGDIRNGALDCGAIAQGPRGRRGHAAVFWRQGKTKVDVYEN